MKNNSGLIIQGGSVALHGVAIGQCATVNINKIRQADSNLDGAPPLLALGDLLESCFDETELRTLAAYSSSQGNLAALLPGQGTPLRHLARATALLFVQRGLLLDILSYMRSERPLRSLEIDHVQRLYERDNPNVTSAP